MTYRVEFESSARKQFLDLPADIRALLTTAIDDLQKDPRPVGSKKITGHPGYRIRKGSYRVLYTVDDSQKLARVYLVGHRKDVYRHL